MVMSTTTCDCCGYASGLARLRVLWLPLDSVKVSSGMGEYVLCAACRSRVMDARAPVRKTVGVGE